MTLYKSDSNIGIDDHCTKATTFFNGSNIIHFIEINFIEGYDYHLLNDFIKNIITLSSFKNIFIVVDIPIINDKFTNIVKQINKLIDNIKIKHKQKFHVIQISLTLYKIADLIYNGATYNDLCFIYDEIFINEVLKSLGISKNTLFIYNYCKYYKEELKQLSFNKNKYKLFIENNINDYNKLSNYMISF